MFRQRIFSSYTNSQEAVFHISTQTSISYSELSEIIAGIAEYLKQQGLKPQSRLLIYANNTLETALIYLACLYSRIIICPLNPKIEADEAEYCTNLIKPDLVLKNFDLAQIKKQKPIPQNYDPNDIYTITFTSGSTGRPKAIVHKAEVLLANANAMNEFTATDVSARFFHVMPIYYMAGILNTILCPIVAGGTLVMAENFGPLTPITFWKNWLATKANATWISPTMASALIGLDRDEEVRIQVRALAKTFKVFCGTAPLRLEIKRQFKQKYDVDLLESYGLSEILFVSVKDLKNNTYNKSVGKLISGVELNVLDSGELEFITNYPMVGYLQEDGTTNGIDGNKFRSGDIGEIIGGELFITGRAKDLIIKGGINISPRQIEEKIEKLQQIRQVAIIGIPDNFYGENIACFYAGDIAEVDLARYCKENLEENKIPVKYISMEKLPVGPTGKIQKSLLKV